MKQKLENGLAVLFFDDETETAIIFLSNDPVLKKLRHDPNARRVFLMVGHYIRQMTKGINLLVSLM